MMRADVYELAAYARDKGLRCVMSPNGTLITPESARKIKEAGFQRCSISIDGADAASHDAFRGVPGAFDASMRGIEYLKAEGVEFQINTTVTKSNLHSFKDIFHLCEKIGAVAWHIFLLVPMGRAAEIQEEVITAEEYEEVLHWFYDFRKTTSMHLKATCAPQLLPHHAAEGPRGRRNREHGKLRHGRHDARLPRRHGLLLHQPYRTAPALRLPHPRLRQRARHPLPRALKKTPWFLKFRDQSAYKGKCGVCEYHKVCGGCRARAYSMTDDPMAQEPLCLYKPKAAK